jgi:transposase
LQPCVSDDAGVVGRGELTDRAWVRIEPVLPPTGGRGGRRRDHRQVIDAILWKLRTGAPWRDLPERYGPWKTAHERLRRWSTDGTWDRILAEVIVKDDSIGAVEWTISVDSSVVRAHQRAAGARKKRGLCTRRREPERGGGGDRAITRGPVHQDPPRGRRPWPADGGATRFAKRATYFRAELVLAAIVRWLRS